MGLFSSRGSRGSRQQAGPTQQPAEAVQEAISQGISSRRKIAEMTGLQPTTVDLILERMERTGQLRRESLGGMCPGGGCSSCGMSTSGTCAGGTANNGPVALVLTRRPNLDNHRAGSAA